MAAYWFWHTYITPNASVVLRSFHVVHSETMLKFQYVRLSVDRGLTSYTSVADRPIRNGLCTSKEQQSWAGERTSARACNSTNHSHLRIEASVLERSPMQCPPLGRADLPQQRLNSDLEKAPGSNSKPLTRSGTWQSHRSTSSSSQLAAFEILELRGIAPLQSYDLRYKKS
jgi:hypothetical protein